MQYINRSNPWIEAASMGRGIGESLANMLMQVPQVRAQMAERQQQMQWQNEDRAFAKQMQPFQLQQTQTQAELGPLQVAAAREGLAGIPVERKSTELRNEAGRYALLKAKEGDIQKRSDLVIAQNVLQKIFSGKPLRPHEKSLVTGFAAKQPELFKMAVSLMEGSRSGGISQGQLFNAAARMAQDSMSEDEIKAGLGTAARVAGVGGGGLQIGPVMRMFGAQGSSPFDSAETAPTFQSEEEARAAGAQSGSYVRIPGIGVIQLD